jgi:dienelactone hydrolase
MSIQTRTIDYVHQNTALQGVLAWDDSHTGPRPGVLVSHAWAGRDEFAIGKAKALAELGYVGFALDMYGEGKTGTNAEENARLMGPFIENRALLQSRQSAALSTLRQQPEVESSQIAAIGFCFGGLCVLDLARSGADLRGVVSFHGLLNPPDNLPNPRISAKILVLHGFDDPMAPPDLLVQLGHELTKAGADWQIHAYGNTVHAFSNPKANDPGFGTVYQPTADRRAWQSLGNFFAEVLK